MWISIYNLKRWVRIFLYIFIKMISRSNKVLHWCIIILFMSRISWTNNRNRNLLLNAIFISLYITYNNMYVLDTEYNFYSYNIINFLNGTCYFFNFFILPEVVSEFVYWYHNTSCTIGMLITSALLLKKKNRFEYLWIQEEKEKIGMSRSLLNEKLLI